MTLAQSPDGVPSEEFAAYCARRAQGGTGLIITEATYIDHPSSGEDNRVSRLYGTSGEPGRTMTRADIDDVIGAFAEAAATAEPVGFDGVELHGAHGDLIDQFLWSATNHRADAYGGDPRSRTRFAAEVLAAVRGAVAPGSGGRSAVSSGR